MSSLSGLSGKRALITGGTSGIGFATAKRFLEAGATVSIMGNNHERLEAARNRLGGGVFAVQANAADVAATHKAIQESVNVMGGLDVLFLNAGIAKFAPLDGLEETLYSELFDVNVKGVLFAAKAAAPLMSDGGSIVATSSVMAHMGMPGSSVYSATKAAVASIVRVLAGELAPRRIRVNAISPGPIETPIYGKLGMAEADLQATAANLNSKIPLGRFGKDDEIARTVLFLASDASSFITATELTADGGWTGVMA